MYPILLLMLFNISKFKWKLSAQTLWLADNMVSVCVGGGGWRGGC